MEKKKKHQKNHNNTLISRKPVLPVGVRTCVFHFHISQCLESVFIGHLTLLLGAHPVVHELGPLRELCSHVFYLFGSQVPSELICQQPGGLAIHDVTWGGNALSGVALHGLGRKFSCIATAR